MCANYHGCSVRSDLEEDRSLGNDSFVTWRDGSGHIYHRWAHVRTRRIALSTRSEGTGVHDGEFHLQSRNNFEADKRSTISTQCLCPFLAGSK